MAAHCDEEGCKNPVRARGKCSKHYQAALRDQADPDRITRQRASGPLERLVLYVEREVAERIRKSAEGENITASAAAVRALIRGLTKK